MKISKQVLSNIFEAAGDFDNANRYADSARKALEAGTLEVEGYERVQWTKFDPSDPKTFPPKTDEYIVAIEGRSTSTTRKYSAQYFEFFAPEKITHWRPCPKPPTETEANDD